MLDALSSSAEFAKVPKGLEEGQAFCLSSVLVHAYELACPWGLHGVEGWLRTLLGPEAVDDFELELVLAQHEARPPTVRQVRDWFDRAR
ncbi:MAG TPA: hypothetical protein RMG48_09260 [Myxococcales bacterium LLY-WYZ-16_1]|nr:hypothetical protein [Myxococcales bacterium LLY-WYZ-16_1]